MIKLFVQTSNIGMDSRVNAARPAAPRRRQSVEPRPDRRQAILFAAQKLFAERGYHAVTIRQIAEAAKVPLALVGYYFGQKHELFIALFEHWRCTIDQRLAALRAVPLAPNRPEMLTGIVEAFVRPVLALRASPEGVYYALLVARQMYQSVDEAEAVLRAHFDPMAHAFIDALHAALPHASRADVAWGYQFALGALLNHLSDTRIERLSHGQNRACDPAAAPLLIAFIAGGMRAALPLPRRSHAASPPAAAPRAPAAAPSPNRRRTAP